MNRLLPPALSLAVTLLLGASCERLKMPRPPEPPDPAPGIEQLKRGIRFYFQADHYEQNGNLLPKQFPPCRDRWTPATACCQQPGGHCSPEEPGRDPDLQELYLKMDAAHRFQWRCQSSGINLEATVEIEVRGDQDCDGRYSSYRVRGRVDQEYELVFSELEIEDGQE